MVYRETPTANWAVPDFVIATARTFKITAVATQDFFEFRRVTGHQEAVATTPLSSYW